MMGDFHVWFCEKLGVNSLGLLDHIRQISMMLSYLKIRSTPLLSPDQNLRKKNRKIYKIYVLTPAMGYAEVVEARQYIAHIRPRGEEKLEIEHNPEFKARHWVHAAN